MRRMLEPANRLIKFNEYGGNYQWIVEERKHTAIVIIVVVDVR